ncbi:MAG: SPOR domain-containing protein [Candidatus Omnitrophica bacterium]|nr:SPOR domain-containing protein [Candidatus Omnitrophota bacterium]
MFRYIIIFLIGFFLGHAFSGNLGLLLSKTKELALAAVNRNENPAPREYAVVSTPAPRPTEAPEAVAEPREKRTTYQAVAVRPKPTPATANREQLYTIQVASFKTKRQATKYVEELVGQQYDAFIAPVHNEKPVDWYRVCIGETISPDQAKILNAKLKSKFKDSFIYSF